MKNLANYPAEIQSEIRNVLTAFDKVTVLFYNGKFRVTTNIAILDKYLADFRVCEEIKNFEVYTEAEMKYNYSQL